MCIRGVTCYMHARKSRSLRTRDDLSLGLAYFGDILGNDAIRIAKEAEKRGFASI